MNLLHRHHHHVHLNFGNKKIQNNWWLSRAVLVRCSIISDRDRARKITTVPARDRIIDFGKYKGKMLGTLPSTYLKWVSNNLRAGDFIEWANLSDEVLGDPIYKDRIEWEFALNVLNGNNSSSLSSSSKANNTPTAVSELVEISERFGWDNLDKIGWSKVDFDLLGTSKGGRIPRRRVNLNNDDDQSPKHEEENLSHSHDIVSQSPQLGRRMQRRERKKLRLRTQQATTQQQHKRNMEYDHDNIDGENKMGNDNLNQSNPIFPGREALVKNSKAINHLTRTTKRFNPKLL